MRRAAVIRAINAEIRRDNDPDNGPVMNARSERREKFPLSTLWVSLLKFDTRARALTRSLTPLVPAFPLSSPRRGIGLFFILISVCCDPHYEIPLSYRTPRDVIELCMTS